MPQLLLGLATDASSSSTLPAIAAVGAVIAALLVLYLCCLHRGSRRRAAEEHGSPCGGRVAELLTTSPPDPTAAKEPFGGAPSADPAIAKPTAVPGLQMSAAQKRGKALPMAMALPSFRKWSGGLTARGGLAARGGTSTGAEDAFKEKIASLESQLQLLTARLSHSDASPSSRASLSDAALSSGGPLSRTRDAGGGRALAAVPMLSLDSADNSAAASQVLSQAAAELSVSTHGAQLFRSSREVWDVLDAYQHAQAELARLTQAWRMEEEQTAGEVEDLACSVEALRCDISVEEARLATPLGAAPSREAFRASVRQAQKLAEQRTQRLVEVQRGWRSDFFEAEREVQGLREELEELDLAWAAEDTQLRERAEQAVAAGVHARVEQARQQWEEEVDAARQFLQRAKRAREEWHAEASSRAAQACRAQQANEKLQRKLVRLAKTDVSAFPQGTRSPSSDTPGPSTRTAAKRSHATTRLPHGRAAHIAEALGTRSLVSPGTEATSLVKPEHNEWEGLQEGADDAFIEAVEAYIDVCSSAQADKKQLQVWQQHAAVPFSEALMELVAMYRTAKPEPKPEPVGPADGEPATPCNGKLASDKGTDLQVGNAAAKPAGKKKPGGGAKKPRALSAATAAQKRDSIRTSAVFM